MDVVRKILESMYCGKCDVVEYRKVSDPVTKKTSFSEVTIMSEKPCRLSYRSTPIAGDDNTANVWQEIKLFLSPDLKIPSGCKIIVTQRGVTQSYTNSSEPIIYDDHQEISLRLFERWA